MTEQRTTVVADYLAIFAVANPGKKLPDLQPTSMSGWFRIDGQRVARKTLLQMTERLRNRIAGKGQVTDAELCA